MSLETEFIYILFPPERKKMSCFKIIVGILLCKFNKCENSTDKYFGLRELFNGKQKGEINLNVFLTLSPRKEMLYFILTNTNCVNQHRETLRR